MKRKLITLPYNPTWPTWRANVCVISDVLISAGQHRESVDRHAARGERLREGFGGIQLERGGRPLRRVAATRALQTSTDPDCVLQRKVYTVLYVVSVLRCEVEVFTALSATWPSRCFVAKTLTLHTR